MQNIHFTSTLLITHSQRHMSYVFLMLPCAYFDLTQLVYYRRKQVEQTIHNFVLMSYTPNQLKRSLSIRR